MTAATAAPPTYFPSQLQEQPTSVLVSTAAPANQWGFQPQPQPDQQYQLIQHTPYQHQHQQQFDPFAVSMPSPATDNTSTCMNTSATSLVSAPVVYQQNQHQNHHQQPQHAPPAAPPPAAPALQDDDPFGVFSMPKTTVESPKPERGLPVGAVSSMSAATTATESTGYAASTVGSTRRLTNNSDESFSSTSASLLAHATTSTSNAQGATKADPPSWLDVSTSNNNHTGGHVESVAYSSSSTGELPSEGEHYQVDVLDRHLGLLLYKASDLSTSVLSHHHPTTIKSIAHRPIVAHLTEQSSAAAAGVGLGDVVTAINGREVQDLQSASRMLRECSRPVTLRMFRLPGPSPRLYEGELWVHYKNKSVEPPRYTKEWKSKYVVVGGIMGRPSVVNMYRSKSEYDQAVAEVHGGRPVTVKVKQFSLEGSSLWSLPAEQAGHCRQQNGVETLRYPTEAESWRYVQVLVPKPGNNIKLAAPESRRDELRSVLEGIRRGM